MSTPRRVVTEKIEQVVAIITFYALSPEHGIYMSIIGGRMPLDRILTQVFNAFMFGE